MSDSHGLLRIVLSKFYPMIGDLCSDSKDLRDRAKVGNLTAWLLLVCNSLESLPPDWDNEEVTRWCQKLLADLAGFFTSKPLKDRTEAWPRLREFFAKNDHRGFKKTWERLLNQESKKRAVENLIHDCEDLIRECFPFNVDRALVNALPDWVYKKRPHDHSTHFNAGLYGLLQHHVTCDYTKQCLRSTIEQSHRRPLHLSRLCLDSCEDDSSDHDGTGTSLELLISSLDLSYWQEVHLQIHQDRQIIPSVEQLKQGKLCEVLGEQLRLRLFLSFHGSPNASSDAVTKSSLHLIDDQLQVQSLYKSGQGIKLSEALRTYKLSEKDKIALAHTIVLAYWQFYGSDLTQSGWTSDNIYFMYQENGDEEDHTLPLTSYLTFPFDAACTKWPTHQQDDNAAAHSLPAILSIGIMLLEIARSMNFPVSMYEGSSRTIRNSRNNNRLQIANSWLLTLQGNKWQQIRHKDMFNTAVEACLTITEKGIHTGTTTREQFYLKVVCPLAYLAKFAFRTRRAGRAHRKNQVDKKPSQLSVTRGVLHTGERLDAEDWMQNLKHICADVEMQRPKHKVRTPVKVAILDTGCDLTLVSSRKKFDVDWKDFTKARKNIPEDSFGHGSLMARLVLECSPSAQIIVARIAEDIEGLDGNQTKVAEAIRWAADRGANIISMSFGFPKDDHEILRAINEVQQNHRVIFLSSAGNLPHEKVSFPARLSSVISISAANYNGTFAESNARIEIGDKFALGTFGYDIPSHIVERFETQFPLIRPHGSSVATAVASAICATVLAYITILPDLLEPALNSTDTLEWIWETKGMEAVLRKAMAWSQASHNGKSFLDLAWFWKNYPKHIRRFCSISNALADVELEGELRRR